MTNLHETQLRFNSKIKIKTDDVQLSITQACCFTPNLSTQLVLTKLLIKRRHN